MANEMTTKSNVTALTEVKKFLDTDSVKKKFADVLGQKAPQFMTSIVNVVSSSDKLKECSAQSILSAALVAATYDLPIDPNLGFSAIVPYANSKFNPQTKRLDRYHVAQYQIMYRGLIQLAIRSGEYAKMNCSKVYADEVKEFNPITGEVSFVKDFSTCTMRKEGKSENVAGYYAWFELKSGFSHALYMTKDEVLNHASVYSKAYRYDVENNKQSSPWSTNFDGMALKTVLKLLLGKWGILSIQMQSAVVHDQETYDEDGQPSYGDNDGTEVPIEATNPFESQEPIDTTATEMEPEMTSFNIDDL